MSFNSSRFANFGKYDLTINKSFFRNMSLITIFGSVGIAILGFLLRWNRADPNCIYEGGIPASVNPEATSITSFFIIGFAYLMMFVFAGYTFHNLRNKQGRISELTIPANNLERWTWHILLSMGGGILALIVSFFCADLVNAILNLLIYHGEFNSSLSLEIFRNLFFIPGDSQDLSYSMDSAWIHLQNSGAVNYVRFLLACIMFCNISIYIFGNSVKYKYNIILTYIVYQVTMTVLTVLLITFVDRADFDFNILPENPDSFETIAQISYYSICGMFLAIGGLFLWGSYRRYCSAQITSRLNR